MTGDRVGAGGYLCWIGSDGFADGRGSGGKACEIPPSGHFMDFFRAWQRQSIVLETRGCGRFAVEAETGSLPFLMYDYYGV
jgi:hypothetical protein